MLQVAIIRHIHKSHPSTSVRCSSSRFEPIVHVATYFFVTFPSLNEKLPEPLLELELELDELEVDLVPALVYFSQLLKSFFLSPVPCSCCHALKDLLLEEDMLSVFVFCADVGVYACVSLSSTSVCLVLSVIIVFESEWYSLSVLELFLSKSDPEACRPTCFICMSALSEWLCECGFVNMAL